MTQGNLLENALSLLQRIKNANGMMWQSIWDDLSALLDEAAKRPAEGEWHLLYGGLPDGERRQVMVLCQDGSRHEAQWNPAQLGFYLPMAGGDWSEALRRVFHVIGWREVESPAPQNEPPLQVNGDTITFTADLTDAADAALGMRSQIPRPQADAAIATPLTPDDLRQWANYTIEHGATVVRPPVAINVLSLLERHEQALGLLRWVRGKYLNNVLPMSDEQRKALYALLAVAPAERTPPHEARSSKVAPPAGREDGEANGRGRSVAPDVAPAPAATDGGAGLQGDAESAGECAAEEDKGGVTCRCHACGAPYHVDLLVPDDLWAHIRPDPSRPVGAGLLCPVCLVMRLEELGQYGAYSLLPVADVEPDPAAQPQPTYEHVYAAYVVGANSGRAHPDVSDHLIRRSADAYCKLVQAQIGDESVDDCDLCSPTDDGSCEGCSVPLDRRKARTTAGEPERETRSHHLKTWPEPFAAICDGSKRFEFRRNDRNFVVGDCLELEEWEPATKDYTGSMRFVRVTYIVYGPAFDVPEGYCVMSIEPWDRSTGEPKPYRPDGDCVCPFPLPRDASQGDLRCARCNRIIAKPVTPFSDATTTTGNVHFVQAVPCPHCGETGICFCGRCQRCGRFREPVEGGKEGGARGVAGPESHTESASYVVPVSTATEGDICEDHERRLERLQQQRERDEERLTHLENAVGEERREVRDRLATLEQKDGATAVMLRDHHLQITGLEKVARSADLFALHCETKVSELDNTTKHISAQCSQTAGRMDAFEAAWARLESALKEVTT